MFKMAEKIEMFLSQDVQYGGELKNVSVVSVTRCSRLWWIMKCCCHKMFKMVVDIEMFLSQDVQDGREH